MALADHLSYQAIESMVPSNVLEATWGSTGLGNSIQFRKLGLLINAFKSDSKTMVPTSVEPQMVVRHLLQFS